MRAAIFRGPRDIEAGERPEPVIREPTDAIVRVTGGLRAEIVASWRVCRSCYQPCSSSSFSCFPSFGSCLPD
jgi:hypothetical protein